MDERGPQWVRLKKRGGIGDGRKRNGTGGTVGDACVCVCVCLLVCVCLCVLGADIEVEGRADFEI